MSRCSISRSILGKVSSAAVATAAASGSSEWESLARRTRWTASERVRSERFLLLAAGRGRLTTVISFRLPSRWLAGRRRRYGRIRSTRINPLNGSRGVSSVGGLRWSCKHRLSGPTEFHLDAQALKLTDGLRCPLEVIPSPGQLQNGKPRRGRMLPLLCCSLASHVVASRFVDSTNRATLSQQWVTAD